MHRQNCLQHSGWPVRTGLSYNQGDFPTKQGDFPTKANFQPSRRTSNQARRFSNQGEFPTKQGDFPTKANFQPRRISNQGVFYNLATTQPSSAPGLASFLVFWMNPQLQFSTLGWPVHLGF
jgi:hypothetical protein